MGGFFKFDENLVSKAGGSKSPKRDRIHFENKTIESLSTYANEYPSMIGKKFEWSSIAQLLNQNKPKSSAM